MTKNKINMPPTKKGGFTPQTAGMATIEKLCKLVGYVKIVPIMVKCNCCGGSGEVENNKLYKVMDVRERGGRWGRRGSRREMVADHAGGVVEGLVAPAGLWVGLRRALDQRTAHRGVGENYGG